ncbi:hypothetical protein C2E20_7602 [Micractinium conductrix]|uniref:AB hydrolase-1 domain-containing protein n=1 Tax=Micractinium conductrix TaxID=554055 RepID=A0A2P6V413_9CHLO|nr:hypothetical protein C2E20_7602 [Micractinium conductrix]|eukprot:PSC68832.1 hypothetical protein C2E20_7602 [Micractinium conductrix]
MPPEASDIEEPAAQALMASMRRVPLAVPGLGEVQTAYAGPAAPTPGAPAFVLLHGFDSSSLEFRRFVPLLSQLGDVYAVDLAGWGFTDAGFGSNPDLPLGPKQKRAHLKAFMQHVVGRPATLIGTSLGGTVAIDFAAEHGDDVERLVLIDAQGFIDGIGPMASMPRFLSQLGVRVLRTVPLRQMANKMAYFDKERYATDDAMRIGRLHTHLPGWEDANVAFMQSGGYAVSARIPTLRLPTLVVWGRNDEILSPDNAQRFIDALPDARLVWIEDCGHCAHLEQPAELLRAVAEFCGGGDAAAAMAGTASA